MYMHFDICIDILVTESTHGYLYRVRLPIDIVPF